MTRREIRTYREAVACDVCGRTLLRGEEAETYVAAGTRRQVCELCVDRALHEGWVREGAVLENGARREHADRRSLMGRLRRRERPERGPAEAPARELVDLEPEEEPVGPPSEVDLDPIPRHVHAVPASETRRIERAVEIFNASTHPRTVAGVARSLGHPEVTVRPSSETAAIAVVVVAWELCWYRYEVDLEAGAEGVRLAGQGYELEELDVEDRAPNAAADERGLLQLA